MSQFERSEYLGGLQWTLELQRRGEEPSLGVVSGHQEVAVMLMLGSFSGWTGVRLAREEREGSSTGAG